MPIIVYWGLAALGAGAGVKLFGDGVEDSAKAARDIAVTVGIGAGVYLIAKKQGII